MAKGRVGGDAGRVSIRVVALASAIGATIEWYDFFLYGVVTALVFKKLFFPQFDPLVGTLLAYTTFLIGFVARPIGGIIFGHFGDRAGRKTILVLTLLVMGIATFLIGLLPSYESAGAWAPILLLVLRIFQGIGIGGEWGGAVLMAVEHSPAGKRGYYGSWPQIGVPAGLSLSAAVVALLSYLPEEEFLAWGWRVAFLLSAILVIVGVYVRLRLMETPAFERVQATGTQAAVPFVELLRTHPKNVLLGMGARYIEGCCFNIYGVFVIGYLADTLKVPRQSALLGVIIACMVMVVMLPIYGALSDRWGRRGLFGVASVLIGVSTFPAFYFMNQGGPIWWTWLAITVPFGLIYPAVYGPQAALFSELFDTRVRYSGISFVYQFSGIFASGLTPIIATALLAWSGGQPWLICVYVLVVSLISALSVYAMSETVRRDIADVSEARA
jgi:MFS transporter, MHS family, shikimate and dehydroshikimate transport protein